MLPSFLKMAVAVTALWRLRTAFQQILLWHPEEDKDFWTLAKSMERPWCESHEFWLSAPFERDEERVYHDIVLRNGRETRASVPNWALTRPAQDAMRQYQDFVENLQWHIEAVTVDTCFVSFTLLNNGLEADAQSVVPLTTTGLYDAPTFRHCFDYMRYHVSPVIWTNRCAYTTLLHVLAGSHPKLAECMSLHSPRSPRHIQRSARRLTCARLSVALLHCAVLCLTFDPLVWIWVCKILSFLERSLLTALLEGCAWLARMPHAILWLQLMCIWNDQAASLDIVVLHAIDVFGQRTHWCTMRHFARLVYAAVTRGARDCLTVLRVRAPTHWTILSKPGIRFDTFDLELPIVTLKELLVEHNII